MNISFNSDPARIIYQHITKTCIALGVIKNLNQLLWHKIFYNNKNNIIMMRNDRCCPLDSDMKLSWKTGLKEDLKSLKNTDIIETVEILKVLSNPIRLKMIILLLKGDYCVCELVLILKEKQNLISYNLGILKKHEIIDSYNQSGDKYYKIKSNGNAIPLINYIKENYIKI